MSNLEVPTYEDGVNYKKTLKTRLNYRRSAGGAIRHKQILKLIKSR